jgi:hypothetical protein
MPSLISLFNRLLSAVVADPRQGHHLVAGGAENAGPAILHVLAAIPGRFTARLDTGLSGAERLHLLFRDQLRGTQGGTVSPFEVAAARVVSQSWLRSCWRAVQVHRVNYVSNVWMLHRTRHGNTLMGRTRQKRRSSPMQSSPLVRVTADMQSRVAKYLGQRMMCPSGNPLMPHAGRGAVRPECFCGRLGRCPVKTPGLRWLRVSWMGTTGRCGGVCAPT